MNFLFSAAFRYNDNGQSDCPRNDVNLKRIVDARTMMIWGCASKSSTEFYDQSWSFFVHFVDWRST